MRSNHQVFELFVQPPWGGMNLKRPTRLIPQLSEDLGFRVLFESPRVGHNIGRDHEFEAKAGQVLHTLASCLELPPM